MSFRKYDLPRQSFNTLEEFVTAAKQAGVALVKLDQQAAVIPKVQGQTVVAQPHVIYSATAYDKANQRILKWEERHEAGRGVIKPDGSFVATGASLIPRFDDVKLELEADDLLVTSGNWEREGVPVS